MFLLIENFGGGPNPWTLLPSYGLDDTRRSTTMTTTTCCD